MKMAICNMLSLLVVFLVAGTLALEDNPPPLPTLPDQYYLRIEANLKESDTIYLTEFYDGPGNRGSAMTFRNNETLWVTYDYEDLQRVFITWGDDGKPNCSVSNLTESGFNIIPFHLKDGKPVVASSAELLRFGDEFNETYIGEDVVRGIPVDHWRRTIVHPGGSMVDLNYYFTVQGYHTATNGSQVPVRATLNGTAPNFFGPNSTHSVNHMYEFFEVHIEPPHGYWSRVFRPPIGVSCIGRRSRKELPRLPEIFSMKVEVLFSTGNETRVTSLVTFYNYPGKLTSVFFRPPVSNKTHLWKMVHDFNYGLTYTIDEGSGSCNVSAFNTSLNYHWDFMISQDGSHVSIQKPTNLFVEPNVTWIYEGESEMRGLKVESWISEPFTSNGRNLTSEIFFASTNYTTERFPAYVTHIPVRKILRYKVMTDCGRLIAYQQLREDADWVDTLIGGITTEMRIEVYDFSHEAASPWQFDTSQCFGEDEQKPLSFDLEGQDNFKNYVQNNTINFHHGVRESVMKGTGLPGSRVTHIEVEEGTNEVLSIFVTLLGVPKIQGNAVNSSQNHSIPMEDAIKELRALIDLGSFTVNFTVGEKPTQVGVVKGSLRENFSSEPTTGVSVGRHPLITKICGPVLSWRDTVCYEDAGRCVSSTETAGQLRSPPQAIPGITVMIAILTLIVGLVIGLFCMAYLQTKYSFRIPYLVQE